MVATRAPNGTLTAALDYAGRGWPVFPLAGKVPRTAHGLTDASTETEQITAWWQRWPDAGIGMRTGRESGLIVVDVDGDAGAESLYELERAHGELPETVRVKTGGGGEHIYFEHPGGEVRNSAGRLGVGLDTRGDGGYIVAPPSLHPSGRRYAWDRDPDEVGLALPPAWLLAKLTNGNGHARPVSEWRELAADGVAEGERNAACARIAGHLLCRGIDPFVCLELVAAWDATRNRPPLGRGEVTRTVESIARREAEKWGN